MPCACWRTTPDEKGLKKRSLLKVASPWREGDQQYTGRHIWLPEVLLAKISSIERFRGLLADEFMDYEADSTHNQL